MSTHVAGAASVSRGQLPDAGAPAGPATAGSEAVATRDGWAGVDGPAPGGCPTGLDSRWLAALGDIVAELAPLDPEGARTLRDLATRLTRPEAVVAFAGHFSAGKSSIINAALGRALLPVGELPETGALCELRAGSVDSAEVVEAGVTRAIPCTTDAIRAALGVLRPDGAPNPTLPGVERVRLQVGRAVPGLPGGDGSASGAAGPAVGSHPPADPWAPELPGIPPRAVWLDCPGINDASATLPRARAALAEADVVIWVLASRQFLSETELAWLATFWRERGGAASRLLLNAFLPEPTADAWKRFLAEQLPRHRQKLLDYCAGLGLDAPHLVAVSASGGDADFGLADLRGLLAALHGPDAASIRRARAARAVGALQSLDVRLQGLIHELAERWRMRIEQAEAADQAAREWRAEIERALTPIVDGYLAQWRAAVRAAVDRIAARANGPGADPTASLNAAIRSTAAEQTRALAGRVAWALGPEDAAGLVGWLEPVPVGVVPEREPFGVAHGALVAAAAFGLGLLFALPWRGGGFVVGVVLGAAIAFVAVHAYLRARRLAGERLALRQSAEAAVMHLEARRGEIIACLAAAATGRESGPASPGEVAEATASLAARIEMINRLRARLAGLARAAAAEAAAPAPGLLPHPATGRPEPVALPRLAVEVGQCGRQAGPDPRRADAGTSADGVGGGSERRVPPGRATG